MSFLRSFAENVYVKPANNFMTALVATTRYPASASFFDTSKFERVLFLIHAGTLDTATIIQIWQDTSATETGDIKVVTGATITIADNEDNKWYSIEVQTNRLDIANDFRYLTAVVTGAAGGNDYADIIILGLGADSVPVTQHASYVTAAVVAG